MTTNKITCETCNQSYTKKYFKKHLTTKKHLKNVEKKTIKQNNNDITLLDLVKEQGIVDIIEDYKKDFENCEKSLIIIKSNVYLYYQGEPEEQTTLVGYDFVNHNSKKNITEMIKRFAKKQLIRYIGGFYKINLKEILQNIEISLCVFENEEDKLKMLNKNKEWNTDYLDKRDIENDYIRILKNENGPFGGFYKIIF